MKKLSALTMMLSVFVFVFSSFLFATPAQANGLVFLGTNDMGDCGGNHYVEFYFESNDPDKDCRPYAGDNGDLYVKLNKSMSPGVSQSYAGVSGYSNHVCQVNVYAPSGSGFKNVRFTWGGFDVWSGTYGPHTFYSYYTF